MTCDSTAYGREAENPDWTKAELDLLDKELKAARARLRLEEAKRYNTTPESIDDWERSKFASASWKTDYAAKRRAAETEVYEKAHDRHYLDMMKRNLGRMKVKNKHGHAHG